MSIAERVLNEAVSRRLPVVLYIDQDKKFLSFDPREVFELNDTNIRDGVKFFHIAAHKAHYLEDSKVAKLEDFGIVGGG